ncbi:hypothetical protein [Pseudonocardia humida]|uniref:Uncharacterized protein n=1 Tax=Pseudonocardia humida TaxID=2800819 RepID=A0ABT0ZT40_9PSEU|nr:hypothetical protein [Pseudonocardia humida]MCO1653853.1 hypothetical protein [Pseudonocardia humida]
MTEAPEVPDERRELERTELWEFVTERADRLRLGADGSVEACAVLGGGEPVRRTVLPQMVRTLAGAAERPPRWAAARLVLPRREPPFAEPAAWLLDAWEPGGPVERTADGAAATFVRVARGRVEHDG